MPYVKLRAKRWEKKGKRYMSFQLTAPKPLVEELGWEQGATLFVYVRNGELIYRYGGKLKGGVQTKLDI